MNHQCAFWGVVHICERSSKRLSLSLVLWAVVAGSSLAGPITIVDQENLNFDSAVGSNLTSGYGQSFTPTLAAIDAFEFFADPFVSSITASNWQINLREGDINGLILGTSSAVNGQIVGGDPINFMFLNRILLNPGTIYVVEILFNSFFPNDLAFDSSASYNGGSAINAGPGDYKFREGLSAPIPEPSTFALVGLVLGVAGLVTHRRKKAT